MENIRDNTKPENVKIGCHCMSFENKDENFIYLVAKFEFEDKNTTKFFQQSHSGSIILQSF